MDILLGGRSGQHRGVRCVEYVPSAGRGKKGFTSVVFLPKRTTSVPPGETPDGPTDQPARLRTAITGIKMEVVSGRTGRGGYRDVGAGYPVGCRRRSLANTMTHALEEKHRCGWFLSGSGRPFPAAPAPL